MINKTAILILIIFLSISIKANACTMYKITKNGKTIVGNNEDYLTPNNQFWYEAAENSKFGVMYMGTLNNFAQGAINEQGLMFDGFYAPYLPINNTEGKVKISIGKAIRQVMQTMSSVEEVKSYLQTINLSSLTNSMLVFVDKSGTYLIVEGDEIFIGKDPEKSFSNFYYSQTKNLDKVNLDYFQNGQKFIDASKSMATIDYCSDAMQNFAQSKSFITTQYSTVYDLNSLKIRVYLFHDYSQFIEIDLKKELKKGNHKTMIADLFPKESIGYNHYLKYNDATHPTLFIEEKIAQQKLSTADLNQMDFADDINIIGYEWLKNKQNPKAAIKVFEYALSLVPNNSDLYDSLGEAYFEIKDWERAIKNYSQSLALDPKNENAVEMLLKAEEEKGKVEDFSFKNLSSIMDQYAESTLKKGNINSLALAIYKDGKTYQQYYGEIDKNSSNKPNDNTLYEIASISKVFVGSLAAKAVLEKKIALNDDIRKYLKGDYPNLQFENTPITIKNLLTHTLGFKYKTPKKLEKVNKRTNKGYYENKPFDYDMSNLLDELKTVVLDKKPGTVYSYNSVGPELLSYVLEQVYHQSYKDLLQEFLTELNMKSTYLQDYDKHKEYLSNGYSEDKKKAPLDKNPLLGGAYGMISNLPDLTKFMKFQLESNAPFIKESTRLLFKEEKDSDDKGYLWDVGFGKKEGFYYGKTGTSNGVQSGMLVCPDSRYGLVLIMNNKSEAALNDWTSLYNRIETDLINSPKINLISLLQKGFMNNFDETIEKYKELKTDTVSYISGSTALNNFGYELLNSKQIEKAIRIFEFAISEDSKNANLYDSAGEAYFIDKNYEKALSNYKKSLELNPKNDNAKKHIVEINQLKSKR